METVDPSPEVDEHETTDQDAWNQNQQQLVSPGFTTLAGVSVHAAYQINHFTGQQRTIVDQNSNSRPRISDARLPLYGRHGNPGTSSHFQPLRQPFADVPSDCGDVPSPLTSFDFSAFLLPPSEVEASGFSYDWFSNDFYSAMKEAVNEDIEFNDMLSLTFQSPIQVDQYSTTPVAAKSWESHPNFHQREVLKKPMILMPLDNLRACLNQSLGE
jgi:hypothetical protein